MKWKYRKLSGATCKHASSAANNLFPVLEYIENSHVGLEDMAQAHNLVGTSRIVSKLDKLDFVRIPGSRPGIMWTCIVRVTGIMSMISAGEGIQHACGQFEHAIDSVNLAWVKRIEKKRGETRFPLNFV
jgi:hypothetical protein